MDIKIVFPSGGNVDMATTMAADFTLDNGQLAMDGSLYTATVISLFTDARAGEDDELPPDVTNRRGWWGDGVPGQDTPEGDKIGSKLWLLHRRKQTEQTRLDAIRYCQQALAWTVEDGHATAVHVTAAWHDSHSGLLKIWIEYELTRGGKEQYGFEYALAA